MSKCYKCGLSLDGYDTVPHPQIPKLVAHRNCAEAEKNHYLDIEEKNREPCEPCEPFQRGIHTPGNTEFRGRTRAYSGSELLAMVAEIEKLNRGSYRKKPKLEVFTVKMPSNMIKWLRSKDNGSDFVRRLVKAVMNYENSVIPQVYTPSKNGSHHSHCSQKLVEA